MSYKPDSEDAAIEQPTIELFAELGWETLNYYQEKFGPLTLLGRETMADVVLPSRLRTSIEKLNPGISPNAVEIAMQEVTANQACCKRLKEGVRITYKQADGEAEEAVENSKPIGWTRPANNDFLLASQFWVSCDFGKS